MKIVNKKYQGMTAVMVIVASVSMAPFLAVFWWILGAMQFGLSAPSSNLFLWLFNMVSSLLPSALFYALILPKLISLVGRQIGYWQAFSIGLISFFFVYVCIPIITLHQFGNDEFIFLSGLVLSLGSAIFLTLQLSRPSHKGKKK